MTSRALVPENNCHANVPIQGDFIYEYAEGAYGWGYSIGRTPQPNVETRTLYDYRTRHASYRADLDSIASFGNFAWIPVWDDHEVADNTYRDGLADANNTEASFVQYDIEFGEAGIAFDQRKMNAVRAYWEWMPLSTAVPLVLNMRIVLTLLAGAVEMDDNLRIWRTFSFGTLMDIIMLDTRDYDRSITDLYWNTDYIHAISNDTGRSMMGSRQENWFYNQLIESQERGAAWRMVGSQTGTCYPLLLQVLANADSQCSHARTSPLSTATRTLSTTMPGTDTRATATALSRPCTTTTSRTTSSCPVTLTCMSHAVSIEGC